MYMILCVIDQPDRLNRVLQAWHDIGIRGVTILESTGLHRLRKLHRIPMRYAVPEAGEERGNFTIFTIVEQEATIQSCLNATESVVGDFDEPDTGIFIALPLSFSKGVTGKGFTAGKGGENDLG
jgi:hypothetical protein